jgi:crotonobetainyl-CoA:carnitine CoA-transferase CaiB-like acyl-CoA transferase
VQWRAVLASTILAAPLTGVRVLDLGTIVAGPSASMILADLGADVIKVELPGGEDGRGMGPHRGEWGAYFAALNRGKRSLAVDFTIPAGRDVLLRLAESCDVFLENFRGGKAAELGLEEQAVRARKPDIVYAALSAYGPRGPDFAKPGYDALVQARTGIMSVTGSGGGEPVRSGVSILDLGAGVWMALGVLAALFERQQSGRGQRVDASLFQTGIMLMAYHLVYQQFTGVTPEPQGSRHSAFAPYGAFPAADGTVLIGISGDRMFERLCAALGKPWDADSRFRSNAERVHHREMLDREIGDLTRMNPVSHWTALFDRHRVAYDVVQDTAQVLRDPQLAALGQMAEVALDGETPVSVPRLPIELSLTPPVIAGPPPKPGEHTRAILREAGYDDGEIEKLVRNGIATTSTPDT